MTAAAIGAIPRPWLVTPALYGDAELVRTIIRARLAAHSLSVALVRPDGTTAMMHARADADTTYEVGSVSKPVTGLLLADAVSRGELRLDDPLGRYLDLRDSPAAALPLRKVATHTAGLPRGVSQRPGEPWSAPYTARDLAGLETDARAAALTASPGFAYSNLGGALVGQAVARAAGTTYQVLVRDRVFTPLGMTRSAAQSERPLVAGGYSGSWQRQPPWLLDGYAPMGGLVSTAHDLALLLRALLAGTAPGSAAMEMAAPFGNGSGEGLLWDLHPYAPGRLLTSHPGGTPGYTAYIGLDRRAGAGVAVLADSKINAEGLGESVLASI